MRVIVTRPLHDAVRWTQALRKRGVDAEALPLIDILPASDLPPVHAAWDRIALSHYHAVMFVSGNAVQHFHALAAPSKASALPRAWATGPGTVAALREAGVATERIDAPQASSGQFDSEALWRIVGPSLPAGRRVLVVRGSTPETRNEQGAGRNWFADQLLAAGAEVDFVIAYERHAARWDTAQFARAREAARDGSVWLLSSSEAIAHLAARLRATDLADARAVATHPRIAEAARAAGFGVVCESRPTVDDVIASIESLA